MRETAKNIDEYMADFPEEVRIRMEKLRSTIQKAAPKAEECINYSMPTFKLYGNLVHFAAYKNHIGFYPGAAVVKDFASELKEYKTSTGGIQFPHTKPIPFAFVTKVVKFRVKQNTEKAAKKLSEKSKKKK